MAGIADLVNNIQDSVQGLVNDLTGKDSGAVIKYHQGEAGLRDVQSQINASSWNKLSFPYTFSIVNLTNPNDNGQFSDFQLPLAPQSINQKEEPAIKIKPSQGGTTVNHGGLGYKSLNIQGTTGISPFRGAGGVRDKTGEAIFQPKQLKYKSGYEVFLHLRNWFRTYYQWKKTQGKSAENYRMIFKNYKDGEFLIVELLSFEMDRQSARSFLYDYKLEFKVLSHYTFNTPASKTGFLTDVDNVIATGLDLITTAKGVMLQTQGILRQVEATYNSSVLEPLRQVTLALKATLGVAVVASDVSSQIIANTVSTVKALSIVTNTAATIAASVATGGPAAAANTNSLLDTSQFGTSNTLQKTLDAATAQINQQGSKGLLALGALMTTIDAGQFPQKTLDATSEEQNQAASLPRSYYDDTITSLERVKQNLEDFANLGSTSYDILFNRTATLSADSSKTVTDQEYALLNAFNDAVIGITLVLSTTDLFKSSYDELIADMNARFDGNIQLLSNQAVKQIKYIANLSLERIAQQELGDSTRWGEIVELNGLKAPYVSLDSQESRDGVIKPGDNLLIPVPLINGFSQAPVGKENIITVGMSELEKSLGVDLKIDSNFDLILTSSGDFELIGGAENMAQGTILKLSYEPGEVMLYPEIGGGLIVGKKFPPLQDIQDRVTNTLLQDNRIQRVANLAFIRDSGALTLSFDIYVKQVDLPIPVKIKVA